MLILIVICTHFSSWKGVWRFVRSAVMKYSQRPETYKHTIDQFPEFFAQSAHFQIVPSIRYYQEYITSILAHVSCQNSIRISAKVEQDFWWRDVPSKVSTSFPFYNILIYFFKSVQRNETNHRQTRQRMDVKSRTDILWIGMKTIDIHTMEG